MKVQDMAQKSDKELAELVDTTRREIGDLVIEYRTKQVKSVKTIAAAKRRLAQALTLLREREIIETEKQNG